MVTEADRNPGVSTTAGTGSEVGRVSVITNEETHQKKIIFHPKMMPGIVIADPELTVGLLEEKALAPIRIVPKVEFFDYEAKYKSDVSTFGGHAYDGLMIVVEATKKTGGTDKAKVRDAIEATKGYVGTGGVVNMSAADHMGLDLTAFRMLEVRNGGWVLVKESAM